MWQTREGVRVLTEAEWPLFAAGLEVLTASIEDDIRLSERETRTGVTSFDVLGSAQQIALLADVATALCDPDTPGPARTPLTDGAVAAVFVELRALLDTELKGDEREEGARFLREHILNAYRNRSGRQRPLPPVTRKSPDAWEELLEGMEARLRGDDMSESPAESVDAPSAPCSFDESGVLAARQVLARLLELPVPDANGLYPILHDYYHALEVGPRPPGADEEWADHFWVHVEDKCYPAGWDCDYDLWVRELRPAVPDEPYTDTPLAPKVPPKGRRGRPTAVVDSLPHGAIVEQRGAQWVVRSASGYWCDLVDDAWGDDEMALVFPTEEEARTTFLQAERMFDERVVRRAAVCARLGIPVPEE